MMNFDDFIITDWTGAPIICVPEETIEALKENRKLVDRTGRGVEQEA